jgi:protein TonB
MTSRGIALTRFRFPVSAMLGVLLTAWYFSTLRALIEVPAGTAERAPVTEILFAPLRPSPVVETKKRVKPPIDKPQEAPTRPTVDVVVDEKSKWDLDVEPIGPGTGAEIPSPGGDPGERGGLMPRLSDSDALPLVRVDPAYPAQATNRGLEGWVHVRYTVTSAGSVEDVVVVKSSHRVFERSAVAAALRWKYEPARTQGEPVASQVETVIRFQLGDDEG